MLPSPTRTLFMSAALYKHCDSVLPSFSGPGPCAQGKGIWARLWAQSAPGIWGLGYFFEGKLYFTNCIVDDIVAATNDSPNPFPSLQLELSKVAPDVQSVKVWHKGWAGLRFGSPRCPSRQSAIGRADI